MGAFISFRLFIVRELTGHFLIVKKIDSVCSKNYRLFSIYFVRFLTERSFSYIVPSVNLFDR